MKVLQYLLSLRPALPLSREKPGGKDRPWTPPSNSEVRRWIQDGSVRINGERWAPDEDMPQMVWELVFFPRSEKNRTTLV